MRAVRWFLVLAALLVVAFGAMFIAGQATP
jgi:hypothetical protein